MAALEEFIKIIDTVQDGSTELDEADSAITELLKANPGEAGDFLTWLEDYHAKKPLPNILLRHFTKRLEKTQSMHATGMFDATEMSPVLGADDATLAATPDQQRRRASAAPGTSDATVVAGDDATVRMADDDEATVVTGGNADGADDATELSGATADLISQGGGDAPVGPGTVLKERFVLEEPLGEGGMGVVYKATDLLKVEAQDKNPHVAIKVLTSAFAAHPESFVALQREASKAQRLAHPNIGTVYDFDRESATIFMTMELLEGSELKDYIKTLPKGGLPVEQALPLIEGMSQALIYAHQNGLIHSDFKPGNCFLTNKGIIKVIDFGIARASSTRDTEGGETTVFDPGQLGALTPAYATCEMFEGEDPHPADDVYALACTSFELLTGTHPYDKSSAPKAKEKKLKPNAVPRKKLTKRQEKALYKAIALDRDQRTQSVEEFLDGIMPKKSHTKQIAFAATALILLVGALLVKPVTDHLKEQEHQAVITQLQSDDASTVEKGLAALNAIPDKSTRDTIALPARQSLLNYFERQIREVLDPDAGKYNYPAAESLLNEAEILFPDSAVVSEYKGSITESKNDLLNEMTSIFNDSLAEGKLLPADGEDDITDVLDIAKVAAPDSTLLKDRRLNVAYAKEAQKAIAANNFARANELLTTSSRYITGDNNLLNLSDQVGQKVNAMQDTEKAREIAKLLATVEPQINDLNTLEQIKDAVFLLRQIEPGARSLRSVDNKAKKLVGGATREAAAAADWPQAEATLLRFAPMLTAEFIDQQRNTLTSAELAAGVEPGTAERTRTMAEIEQLMAKADFSSDWDRDIKRSLLQLAAADPGGMAATEPTRRTLANRYAAHADKLREAKRFLGARQTLEFAQSIAPPDTQALTDSRDALASAERAFEAELAEKARLAELDGRKQTMLTQLQANDLKKGLATFASLREELVADDPFLTETGPAAIEKAYLRLADNLAGRQEYQAALSAVNSGLEELPESAALQRAQRNYADEALVATTRSLIESANQLNVGDMQKRLAELKTRLPQRFEAIDSELQSVMRSRIKELERSNLRRAYSLRDDARKIWPQSSALAALRLKDLPKPSVYAAKGIGLAENGLLTQADEQLAQARRKESRHLDTAQLEKLISSKKSSANTSFDRYKSAAAKEDYESAKTNLNKAMTVWKDNPEFIREREQIKTMLAKIAAGARPCRTKLAGLGRNRRAVCFDIIGTDIRGPALVVIPAGGGSSQPFAITKFEVSEHDMAPFCRATRKCSAPARSGQPATGMSPAVMDQFAAWLSSQTGYSYSIPTLGEWTHAASSGGSEGNADYNCLLRLGNQVIKGQAMLKITSGKPNKWGLVNYVGNAQEVVSAGGGKRAAGGHFQDPMSECSTKLVRSAPGGGDSKTGFRLKRAIN